MSSVRFGVLGPVTAWTAWRVPSGPFEGPSASPAGVPSDPGGGSPEVRLKGPMHRAVLARLLVARRRVVPLTDLIDDLWVAPPAGAASAVRTFVAALRRALEPSRVPRTPPSLLVTRGSGYALLAEDVDAWSFERAVRSSGADAAGLEGALGLWRGPAYADFSEASWVRADRARLTELRLRAVERRAGALLDAGRAHEAVADLDAHVTEHPWREEGWRLLALALYRTNRQADALAVLRRARDLLGGRLGIDPGPALRDLETAVLRQDPRLADSGDAAERVWERTAAAVVAGGSSRVRLESAVVLLRNLAVSGPQGLEIARDQRAAAVVAAEQLGEPSLTARVIGAYDVPAIWTRSDDPDQSALVVSAARRALASVVDAPARARLLATIAVESRGSRDPGALAEAREGERLARELDDPGLLAFALNGLFMQGCHRAGQSSFRAAVGAELITLGSRHGLVTSEILGHLIALQAAAAVIDFRTADVHAGEADRLASAYSIPLVGVFTLWYRALRADVADHAVDAEARYRAAAAHLHHSGMPGVEAGLLPLALLGLHLRRGLPLIENTDYGPYEPWVRPLFEPGLVTDETPPADLLAEAMWCLMARAGSARARAALMPAAGEWAGAASGMLTLGPVSDFL